MYLFKDIYQSNYQLLQKYYNNNELASFVFNQLIKEVFKKDYILIKKDHCVNDQTISLLNDYIYKITIFYF